MTPEAFPFAAGRILSPWGQRIKVRDKPAEEPPSRNFLVLVVVLVIETGKIEDEDDSVAAWPRCAVSPPRQRLTR